MSVLHSDQKNKQTTQLSQNFVEVKVKPENVCFILLLVLLSLSWVYVAFTQLWYRRFRYEIPLRFYVDF